MVCSTCVVALFVLSIIIVCLLFLTALIFISAVDHVDERAICNAVAPAKDVDGFHVVNVGRMCLDQSTMLPATPWGVWEIIKRTGNKSDRLIYNFESRHAVQKELKILLNFLYLYFSGIPTFGKNVLVAGRSKNVGMPIAMLLHTDGRHERPGGGLECKSVHMWCPVQDMS